MPNKKTAVVRPGERIDHLAQRLYGDPRKYKLLIKANPYLDIWYPQVSMRVEVPNE